MLKHEKITAYIQANKSDNEQLLRSILSLDELDAKKIITTGPIENYMVYLAKNFVLVFYFVLTLDLDKTRQLNRNFN